MLIRKRSNAETIDFQPLSLELSIRYLLNLYGTLRNVPFQTKDINFSNWFDRIHK